MNSIKIAPIIVLKQSAHFDVCSVLTLCACVVFFKSLFIPHRFNGVLLVYIYIHYCCGTTMRSSFGIDEYIKNKINIIVLFCYDIIYNRKKRGVYIKCLVMCKNYIYPRVILTLVGIRSKLNKIS